MIRFIKDDDYDKIYNRYMIDFLDQGKFQAMHYAIYFKYFDGILETETPLNNYINGLSIENNYEKSFTSIITVKLILPSAIAARIIKLHSNKDKLKFYFNFVNSSPYLNKGIVKNITEQIDIMSDVLNNSFDNTNVANNFNHSPYNDTPFIISDIKYQIPEMSNIMNDLINKSMEAEADHMRAGFELTLYLINENAMNFSKTNMSFIINNATIDSIMYNMVLKASTGLRPNSSSVSGNADSTYKYIEKPHNSNPNTQIMIDNSNVASTLSYLEDNYGIYLTGHDYFIEGKYLYIGDKMSDNLLKNTDIYIEIIERDFITSLPDKNGMMLIEPPEANSGAAEGLVDSSNLFNNSLYVICLYTSVMINNNEKVNRELSGDNLKVLYKTKEADLKLPDSLQSINYSNHYNIKTYEKKTDAVFFESKLISNYSSNMGNITVVLTSINPDIFHTGKQVILHFNNPLMSEIHNGKYKVLSKTINFQYGKRRTDLSPQITLILVKVLDYIPYDIDELTENLIYRYSTNKAETLLTTEADLKNKYINNQVSAITENIKLELKNSFMFKMFNSNGVTNMYLNEHMKKTLPKLSEKVELIQKNFTTGKESVIEAEVLKNYKRLMSLLNILYTYVEGRWKYTVNGVSYNVYCNPFNGYRTQREEMIIAQNLKKEQLGYSSQHMFGEAMDTHYYYGTEPNLKNRIKDTEVIKSIAKDLFLQFGNNSKATLNATATKLIDTYNSGNRNIIQQIGFYTWGNHIGVVPDRKVGVIPGAYVFDGGY